MLDLNVHIVESKKGRFEPEKRPMDFYDIATSSGICSGRSARFWGLAEPSGHQSRRTRREMRRRSERPASRTLY